MDLIAPFLYQFIGGGVLLLAGLWGANRAGAIDFSSKQDRWWTLSIFLVVLVYFIMQAAFQFVFSVPE